MKFLKFLGARCFGSRAAERRFEILKFTPEPLRNRFEILKFALASTRLADTAQNFISRNGFKILKFIQELPFALRCVLSRANKVKIEVGRRCGIAEKRRAVKLTYAGGYLNSARHYIARFCSAAVRHGYKVGREEKFSKFSLAGALLNFISLPPRKFKLVLLKFMREVPRNRFEILKFTLALRKFKLAPAVRLNFALNSVPQARAVKFEHGVKFEGAIKFKKGTR